MKTNKKKLSETSNLNLKKKRKNYLKFFAVLHVAVQITRRTVSREINSKISWHISVTTATHIFHSVTQKN